MAVVVLFTLMFSFEIAIALVLLWIVISLGRSLLRRNETPHARESTYLCVLFQLMGHLAKSDGSVSTAEIAFAESVIDDVAGELDRETAIDNFNLGKSPEYELKENLRLLGKQLRGEPAILAIELLADFIRVDHAEIARKEQLLRTIGLGLGVPQARCRRCDRWHFCRTSKVGWSVRTSG